MMLHSKGLVRADSSYEPVSEVLSYGCRTGATNVVTILNQKS